MTTQRRPCPVCAGSAVVPGTRDLPCPTCAPGRLAARTMTKRDEATGERKLAGIEDTLAFIRTQYTEAERATADMMVMDLEGQRAYLRGLLRLVRQEG